MNREIKFRAWDKLRNRMERFDLGHKDGLLYQDGNWFVATGYDGEDNPTFDDDNVPRRYELMQFTGLKDKNGVEIYEGDILSARSHWGGPDSKLPKVKNPFITSNWIVEWIGAGWELKNINFKESGGYKRTHGDWFRYMAMLPTDDFYREYYEPMVIGNIYENPDLVSPDRHSNSETVKGDEIVNEQTASMA